MDFAIIPTQPTSYASAAPFLASTAMSPTKQAWTTYASIYPRLPDRLLEISDPHAMHIDTTILPLREGLLVYNPTKVTEAALRRHSVLANWDLRAYPFIPEGRDDRPLYMTSPWLCLNALVLDGERVVVEAGDERTAGWYEELGMRCIRSVSAC